MTTDLAPVRSPDWELQHLRLLIQVTREMRTAQNEYRKRRDSHNHMLVKAAEDKVDVVLLWLEMH